MKIPINTPILGKDEIKAIKSILLEGSLTSSSKLGGKNVQEFEKLASSYVKSKFAIAVNSGTAALQAALYALDVKKGDEVLLPSFTFVATANSVMSVGAKPVFVDILKENFTMDPTDLKKKITKKVVCQLRKTVPFPFFFVYPREKERKQTKKKSAERQH